MFKSTDMVETRFGYVFGMFGRSDAGIEHNTKYFASEIVMPEMFTET